MKFQYDEDTGLAVKDERGGAIGDGEFLFRRGPAPCRLPKGCPKGTPEKPKTLSAKNRKAYQHYQACKATGNFPDDAMVSQNAGLIAALEAAYDRGQVESTQRFIRQLSQVALRP